MQCLSGYGKLLAQASPCESESDVLLVKKLKGQRSQDQSENDVPLVQKLQGLSENGDLLGQIAGP